MVLLFSISHALLATGKETGRSRDHPAGEPSLARTGSAFINPLL